MDVSEIIADEDLQQDAAGPKKPKRGPKKGALDLLAQGGGGSTGSTPGAGGDKSLDRSLSARERNLLKRKARALEKLGSQGGGKRMCLEEVGSGSQGGPPALQQHASVIVSEQPQRDDMVSHAMASLRR